MRIWKPIFIENSKVPVVLSKIAPINISAITMGFIVFSRDEMSDTTKNHETIHFQQFLETAFIGFIFLYFLDYLIGYIKFRDGKKAYMNIRAEREAYAHDQNLFYLLNRKRWAWIKFGSNLKSSEETPNGTV